MKKTILTMALLMIIASQSSAVAQNENSKNKTELKSLTVEEIAAKHTARMKKSLGLTDEQEKNIYDLNLEYAKQKAALRTQRKALKEKAKKNHEDFKNSLDQELSAEQLEKLKAIKAERIKKRTEKQGMSQPPKPPTPAKP